MTTITVLEFMKYLNEPAPTDPVEALAHVTERIDSLTRFAIKCAQHYIPEYTAEVTRLDASREALLKIVGVA